MRIAYVILTCEKHTETLMKWQQATCLSKVPREDIYYLGHTMDPDKRVFNWGAGDLLHQVPEKLVGLFKNAQFHDYDWIVIADDDTYIFTDRVHRLLSKYKLEQRLTIGCTHEHEDLFEYNSSGAGVILSKMLYNAVSNVVKTVKNPIIHWCADICLGSWIHEVHKKNYVKLGSNRHFHNDYYDPLKDSLATAITFHHCKEKEKYDELYLYEYTNNVIN